jgi:phosphoribosylformylglycinamidine synthase
MLYHVEVAYRKEIPDPLAAGILADIRELGVGGVECVKTARVFLLETGAGRAEIEMLVKELLADPIINVWSINSPVFSREEKKCRVVQVVYKHGVTDPWEESVTKGALRLGVKLDRVKTARKTLLEGNIGVAEAGLVAARLLANEVVEEIHLDAKPLYLPPQTKKTTHKRSEVPLLGASENELARISKEGILSLNAEEMRAVQEHFKSLGREPSEIELETIAQTWSEHCVHKTFTGVINMDGRVIKSLLKTTIKRATETLAKKWCVSVFKDNAGVIEFDENYHVCFKVETHNHPSALEPYGGAGTGIGGVIRDPLGTGLGAKPIANTDVFCFGLPDMPADKLPKGALHPKRVMKGVVSGVRDYGNRMGIPTVNGAIYFDERYTGNCLVYAGTVGLLPRGMEHKEPRAGDLVLLVGGRTGRDGIHGVTFASVELTEESERISSGAVQIGNAIVEKKMMDGILQARDRGLYDAITDCGGGGLSSAVGEMGAELGVEVNLEKVPLKYEGLAPWEIWISEAQERMILSVPPERENEILDLFASEDVDAVIIGRFTGDGKLTLKYGGAVHGVLDMKFLHDGRPEFKRNATWKPPKHKEPGIKAKDNYNAELHAILSSPNVASKEWVIRQYDHEVQAQTVIKPLVGVCSDGPGDAAVLAPVLGSKRGIVIACGMNPKYSDIDPYAMAMGAVDEALRNVISVGCSLERVAILDNFSWGNPDKPDRLGSLVRAAEGAAEAAIAFGAPFVSGKDSLNNEFKIGGESVPIPGTLLISALAVMEDVTKAVTMDLKSPGNRLYIVGATKRELGGSHYYALSGHIGNSVPQVDVKHAKETFDRLASAAALRFVRSIHDLSEGGLAVAAAEMAFAGGVGAEIALADVLTADGDMRDDEILFSESHSRFLVEVTTEKAPEFEAVMGDRAASIGKTTDTGRLVILGLGGKPVISENLDALKESWQKTLRW